MKLMNYLYTSLLATLLFSACGEDNVGNPTFADDEIPYIYMDWAGTYVYKLGDVVEFSAQISPAEGTTCRWMVNDKVVSETTSVAYTIETAEPFTLRFEVERNGIKNFRTAQITVTKDFEAKKYNRVAMGVITPGCNADLIQWEYVTHLMYSSLIVSDDTGSLTLPDANALTNLKTIVSLAHNNGVYVILDISGSIVYPAGSGIYNETAFNDVAINPAKRTQLIDDIKSFVDEYGFDGVNIYMNNLNNDAGKLQEPEELVSFMNELAETFPGEREAPYNHFFLTASVPMAWNNYEFYFLGRIPRLDWVNFLLFGGTDLTPVHHAPDWQVTDNIIRFRDSAGIPVSKMLIGVGAFGIKYDIPAGISPTWGNLDSFLSYPTYGEIVKMDATAPSKDMLDMGGASLYYVGVSSETNSVNSKASLVIENDVKGMFVWTLDYDTQHSASSLMQAVYRKMNP